MVTAMRRYLTKSWFVPGLSSSKYFSCMAGTLDAEGLVELAVTDEPFHDRPRHHDAGEHGSEEPDDERGCEAAHRPRAVVADDEPRHQRRHVPVEDRREHLLVAGGHRLRDGTALLHLLADALVDEHVGVHGHAQREHESGDARQRE